jgi:hypothetical protein
MKGKDRAEQAATREEDISFEGRGEEGVGTILLVGWDIALGE